MNDILTTILVIIAIIILSTLIVASILLYGENLKDQWQTEAKLLDCPQLLKDIQDSPPSKRDYIVREWIGDECWKHE